MAKILLIDSDDRLAAELTDFLDPWKHRVIWCHNASAAIAQYRKRSASYDVIALNMSRNRQEDWKALDQLSDAAPWILCFSTAYWGPQMQLAVERKGARLVYLR